jgi:hypothetical protein
MVMIASVKDNNSVLAISLILNIILGTLLFVTKNDDQHTANVESLEQQQIITNVETVASSPEAMQPEPTQVSTTPPPPPLQCPPCERSYSLVSSDHLLMGAAQASKVSRYGARPWGSGSHFVEPNAYWIWAPGVSSHSKWLFFTFFTIESSMTIDVTLHLICDQYGVAYVDGNTVTVSKEKGWLTPDYSKSKISLSPGNHLLAIYAENATQAGGGVIAALVSEEGSTLLYTDTKWKCKKIK